LRRVSLRLQEWRRGAQRLPDRLIVCLAPVCFKRVERVLNSWFCFPVLLKTFAHMAHGDGETREFRGRAQHSLGCAERGNGGRFSLALQYTLGNDVSIGEVSLALPHGGPRELFSDNGIEDDTGDVSRNARLGKHVVVFARRFAADGPDGLRNSVIPVSVFGTTYVS